MGFFAKPQPEAALRGERNRADCDVMHVDLCPLWDTTQEGKPYGQGQYLATWPISDLMGTGDVRRLLRNAAGPSLPRGGDVGS